MTRKLLLPVLFVALAGALSISGCSKNESKMGAVDSISGPTGQPDSSFVFYCGNKPAAEFQFLKLLQGGTTVDTASPNGNTAWFGFTQITNPGPTTNQTATLGATTGVDSFKVLYAPAISSTSPFPNCSVVSNNTVLALPAGARSIIVPLYKTVATGANWIPFDSVTYTPNTPNTYYGSGVGAIKGTVSATYKSTSGAQSAVVTITVNAGMAR